VARGLTTSHTYLTSSMADSKNGSAANSTRVSLRRAHRDNRESNYHTQSSQVSPDDSNDSSHALLMDDLLNN
jgi:hypothetical protein